MSEDGLPEVLFRARLQRQERSTPWGFRLQGGVEFNKPLTLLKVIPASVAANVGLNAGDILVRLAGRSAVSMTHRDAQQAILNSGNTLEIIVERADVTCPSLSVKGQLDVDDLNSETPATEKQIDLKNSGINIEEDGLNSNPQISDKFINNLNDDDEDDPTENVLRQRNSGTQPKLELDLQQLFTSTTPANLSAIPTNATPTTNHHQTPLVDTDPDSKPSVPPTAVQPMPENRQRDNQQNAPAVSELPGVPVSADGGVDDSVRNEEKLDETKLMMVAAGTVLTDHNDNIPLDLVERQNSFPVRALIKTNALTSELCDESSEGTDDQSSEFSDDISVIEMQMGVSGTRGDTGGDEEETVPDTSSLFYQDETEYREISLLNFDERFLEPPRSPESSEPDTEMNRMRACFYIPSFGSDVEPKGGAVSESNVPLSPTANAPPVEVSSDKSPRDFSQTAPWRLSNKGVVGGSRRTDDSTETVPSRSQPICRNEPETHSTVAAYVANEQDQQRSDYPATDNVIYIPISIFGQQLKVGSEYSFQRKSPTAPETEPLEKSSPASLTLVEKRTEKQHPPVSNSFDKDKRVAVTTAVTIATSRVYIAPITSQSSGGSAPAASADEGSSTGTQSVPEARRLSSEVLYELQDIPLPAVKDIVADLNSRLERVVERYETSTGGGNQSGPSVELGTSFGRPERRRSSSGSESDKEIIIEVPPLNTETKHRMREQIFLSEEPTETYSSVVYRTDLSPKPSIRRFSLPGGSVTVKDNAQRRVRFAEPPESSVIEIEGRQRRLPGNDRVIPTSATRIASRDNVAGYSSSSSDAEYVSVCSLAEKLDRIELENALASAAMKRSRPFQPQVSSLLASHPAHPDIRASSPNRGGISLAGRAAWKLEPIQERVINIQTFPPPSDIRRDDQQFRIGPKRVQPLGTVQCSSDFGGIFSLSIGPGSGGHLNLSLQQHPNHGSSRKGFSPTKVNLVLPTTGEVGKSEQFSYSVSTGVTREPIKYTLPPSYEESVLAMAAGRHPRSSSLDDAKAISGAGVATPTVFPSRVSELRAESQLVAGNFPPQQPGLRVMRAQSPTIPGASHPGWVISTAPVAQDSYPRRASGYSQTLQVDTGSKQQNRAASASLGLPVFHARSGALSSDLVVGYQTTIEGSQSVDPFLRIIAQPSGRGKQGASGDLSRPDITARLGRGGSPLILSPTGISNPGSSKPMQGAARSFSPASSPSGPDRRWPPAQRLQGPHGPSLPAPTVVTAEAPLHPERRWPGSLPLPLSPSVSQPPFMHESHRQAAPPTPTARMFPDVRGLPPSLQRMPGIFALLDKTFTDKVMQWEGPGRSGSGGLQQSETYKLVREMDNAMKQDKL